MTDTWHAGACVCCAESSPREHNAGQKVSRALASTAVAVDLSSLLLSKGFSLCTWSRSNLFTFKFKDWHFPTLLNSSCSCACLPATTHFILLLNKRERQSALFLVLEFAVPNQMQHVQWEKNIQMFSFHVKLYWNSSTSFYTMYPTVVLACLQILY